MFLLLRELAAAGELELAGLAHVNHHIRPGASDDDEAFCRALAARMGVPAVVVHADVPALAREHRQSIEVAGRHARHRALADAALQLGADRIATAHTRDDQAETVLLHLTRGAGLSGARGIEPQAGTLIRPVLDCTRAQLRRWLEAADEPWREDETNLDVTNPRNRLRHVVLPMLREHFNPAVDAALGRFADILREDHGYLSAQAEEAARQIISALPESLPHRSALESLPRRSVAKAGLAVDAEALARLPRALGRRVARIALETAHLTRSYDLEEADALVEACYDQSASPKDLPGVRMERSGRFVVLHRRGASRGAPTSGVGRVSFEYELPVPGQVSVEESRVVVEAAGPFDLSTGSRSSRAESRDDFAQDEPLDLSQGELGDADGLDRAIIQADELADGLLVRNRRNGDRLRLWRVGHKKLQDLFVDRKVDRLERDRVPIVTDRAGRIIWVAGHAVAEEFRVGPSTNTVVTLRLRPLRNRGPRPA